MPRAGLVEIPNCAPQMGIRATRLSSSRQRKIKFSRYFAVWHAPCLFTGMERGGAAATGKKEEIAMTAEVQKTTNIMLRNDTILGVCEAIGQDVGINPNWLRVAFCVPVFWNPTLVMAAYLALGVIVAATRFAFPDRAAKIAAPAQPSVVESLPPVVEEQRELIAA
jgi:phage shock protein C